MLHEEMIVCKLREAESSMTTKQLQNELFEIQRLWQVSSADVRSFVTSAKKVMFSPCLFVCLFVCCAQTT